MATFKDICEKFDSSVLQTLYKKVSGDNGLINKDVFPVALVQGVFDALSGMRLDDILSHYNYINLEYKGTDEATRLAIPIGHRRSGLIITYKDYDDNRRIEQYVSENINDNDWQNTANWKTPFTEGVFTIYVTDAQLKKYINEYFDNKNISQEIGDAVTNQFNEYITSEEGIRNLTELINRYLNQHIEEFMSSTSGQNILNNIVNSYLPDIVNNLFNDYISTDEMLNNIRGIIQTMVNDYLGEFLTDEKLTTIVNNIVNDIIDEKVENSVGNKVNEYFASTEFTNLINNIISGFIQDYLEQNLSQERLEEIITNAIQNNINTALNNYFNSEAGQTLLRELITPMLEPLVGEFFEAVQQYLLDNERVIANALARHEQAITDLQNN